MVPKKGHKDRTNDKMSLEKSLGNHVEFSKKNVHIEPYKTQDAE